MTKISGKGAIIMRPKKILLFLVFIIFFVIGFTLKINTSANEEMKVIKHIEKGEISHLEVIAPKGMTKITLEAYDENGDITHFFVLEDYIATKNYNKNANSFFITNRTSRIEDIDTLFFINGGNIKIPLEIEEADPVAEVASALVSGESQLNGGSVDNLKIMSYNIHHGRDLFQRYSLDEIVETIKESNADIIGLQELDNGVARSRFQDQIKFLSQSLSMEYAYGYNYNVLGGMYGNGILSKYPIESYENFHLPSGREQRGLLSATINVEGKKVTFLTTHLGLTQEERRIQVQAINKYLDTIPYPAILVGDFNARSNSEEVQLLTKRMIDAAYATGNEAQPTFDLPMLSSRIDYILLDQAFHLQDYKVTKSRGSDHYPITATIQWREDTEEE